MNMANVDAPTNQVFDPTSRTARINFTFGRENAGPILA